MNYQEFEKQLDVLVADAKQYIKNGKTPDNPIIQSGCLYMLSDKVKALAEKAAFGGTDQ